VDNEKYKFTWDLIGDVDHCRPNLGLNLRLEVYRLMEYTLRDVISQRVGTDACDELFYQAGQIAGKALYENVLGKQSDVNSFVRNLQDTLKILGVGILRIEEDESSDGRMIISVSEDLDCSGLPVVNDVVCKYDEGFIAGLLESFFGSTFSVKEIDCWCTGDRTCRFEAIKGN
jgi:Predicted hydrocarbon binding protein (contains V4R domain)